MTALPSPRDTVAGSDYQPIPMEHLFAHAAGDFEIYLRHGDSHTLFARSGETISQERHRLLTEHGVSELYIHREEYGHYRRYMQRYMGQALLATDMPLAQKAAVFYYNCRDIVRHLLRSRLPRGLTDMHGRLLETYVRHCAAFLATDVGLARIGELVTHDYDVYSHGVHVLVYTLFLLKSLGLSRPALIQAGVGALLHDSGKGKIDLSILRKPDRLTTEELLAIREHPVCGERFCRPLSLSRMARECILMHHEKMDGRGYPGGRSGEDIPLQARAVSLADAYDALTSRRIYADAVRPFEALRIMRHEMAGSFDLELYKRFVLLLGGAALL